MTGKTKDKYLVQREALQRQKRDEWIGRAIARSIERVKSEPATIVGIRTAVSETFGMEDGVIEGRSMKIADHTARGLAMALARRMTKKSFLRIGNYFGNRDSTTVWHAARKFDPITSSAMPAA
jgi:chromosomal replication initiator protein